VQERSLRKGRAEKINEPCVISTIIQCPQQGHAEGMQNGNKGWSRREEIEAQLRLRTVVLKAQRNLKMYVVPPVTSRMHKPRPTAFSQGVQPKPRLQSEASRKKVFKHSDLSKRTREKKRICCMRK